MKRWRARLARLAEHPSARAILFAVAVVEASVFPIPPDVMLLPMVLAAPQAALRLALLTSLGSVLGAAIGYALGAWFLDALAMPLIEFYHLEDAWRAASVRFAEYGAWFVLLASFSPLPFKVATLAAGALGMPFGAFLLACVFGRSARFFSVALLTAAYGEAFLRWAERHAQILSALAAFAAAVAVILLWALAGG